MRRPVSCRLPNLSSIPALHAIGLAAALVITLALAGCDLVSLDASAPPSAGLWAITASPPASATVTASGSPAPTRDPLGFVDLPTLPSSSPGPGGTRAVCAGVGFSDSILHGSPVASEPVWLDGLDQPSVRTAVRWPAGFRARFSPTLELLDPTGAVVAREGDRLLNIAGSMGRDGRFIIWAFNGRSYAYCR